MNFISLQNEKMKNKSLISGNESKEFKKNRKSKGMFELLDFKVYPIMYILVGLLLFCSLVLNVLLYINKKNLDTKISQLSEKLEEKVLVNNQNFQNLNNSQEGNKETMQDQQNLQNLYNNLKQRPSIDPFSEIERFGDLEQSMNDIFGDFDSQFNKNFEVNIVPKGSAYMNFSNTYTINEKIFHYNIQVDGNNINGKISSDNLDLLNKYIEKLKKMGMTVEIDGNEAKFAGMGMDTNAVLEIFQIQYNIKTPETEDEISF